MHEVAVNVVCVGCIYIEVKRKINAQLLFGASSRVVCVCVAVVDRIWFICYVFFHSEDDGYFYSMLSRSEIVNSE